MMNGLLIRLCKMLHEIPMTSLRQLHICGTSSHNINPHNSRIARSIPATS